MAVIDVLDGGLLSELGLFEAAVETTVLPFRDLSVDHEAQSLLEGEVIDLGHIHLFFESAGHSGEAKGLQFVECGMNQHNGSPSFIVVGTPEVFVEEGLWRWYGKRHGLTIQSIFEDGLDASIASAADRQGPMAGGLQPVFSVGLGQVYDPEATAEPLLGMRS